MLNCRQVTRLVSQAMDAKLPWHLRLGMRVHLLYCVWCRRYAAHLRFLRKAAKELAPSAGTAPSHRLSAEAKAQLRTRLQEALRKGSPPS
jgi:hypothetical protein